MSSNKLIAIYRAIERYNTKMYWMPALGFARSLIALGTLLTLLFNGTDALFLVNQGGVVHKFSAINIYSLIPHLTTAKYISVIVLIAVIIGVFPRITCIPHAWVTLSFSSSSILIEGGDQIATIVTILLIPVLLLDKRSSHWVSRNYSDNFYVNGVAMCCFVLIKLQVSAIYFFSGVSKFSVPEWRDGTAIYYWFKDPTFGLNDHLFFLVENALKNPYLVSTMTWLAIAIELFLGGMILNTSPHMKRFSYILGIFFHLCIAISFGLVSFSIVMIGCLTLYFYWGQSVSIQKTSK